MNSIAFRCSGQFSAVARICRRHRTIGSLSWYRVTPPAHLSTALVDFRHHNHRYHRHRHAHSGGDARDHTVRNSSGRALYHAKQQQEQQEHDVQPDKQQRPLSQQAQVQEEGAPSSDEDKDSRLTWDTMLKILRLVQPDVRLLALGMACLAVSTSVSLAVPICIGSIVDALVPAAAAVDTALDTATTAANDSSGCVGNSAVQTLAASGFDGISATAPFDAGATPSHSVDDSMSRLRQSALVLGGMFVVGGLATAGRVLCVGVAGERIAARLRRRVFANLIEQEVAFFDRNRAGELSTRLSTDVQLVSDTLTRSVVGGMRSAAEGIGGIALLCYLSLKLTGVAMAVFPVLGIAMMFYGRIVRSLSRRYMDGIADATSVATERFANIRTVKLFAREDAERVRYDTHVQQTYELGRQVAGARSAFHAGAMTAANFAVLLVLYFGGAAVIAGHISTGALTSFLLYSIYVGISFTNLGSVYGDIMRAVGASQRVMQLLERHPQIPNRGPLTSTSTPLQQQQRLRGQIRFCDVYFAYPTRPSVHVLNKFSLDIAAGKCVAIVGRSGSGKSTLAALISRLYDVNSGQVLVDGVDVRQLDPRWLRQQVGVVSQNPVLFNASIADNIRYGGGDNQEEVPFEAVVEAARQANAHDFIMSLPDGYETMVGERGLSVSGGQSQRIAIARALIKNPRILLLDEATSALDAESEYQVQQALECVMKGRTTLVIAHRLSTIQSADYVCVIAQGKAAEIGTHEELMAHEGIYKDLISRQQLITTIEDKDTSTSLEMD